MSVAAATGPVTVVSYHGSLSGNTCNYCQSTGGCSFYLQVKSLTVQHYQFLVDRGWRRSGHLLYKPHMKLTCCKQYTIRLNAKTFKPSRDQRQCLHKWTRYILGDEYIRDVAKKYPKSKEEKKKQKNEFDLSESVHAPDYPALQGHIPPEPAHKFEVTLELASFTEEKYAVFENYQRNVHKEEPEEISESGFTRFLCDSPLNPEITLAGKKLGSYHQCYRLDGRLIAVGVLDLLPNCVSGVYFIYHEDFEKWHMGKLSACREACLAKEGDYGYYYMGYYIHTCAKMRYKGEYGPSELLDPENNEWNELDKELKTLLDNNPYCSPSSTNNPGTGNTRAKELAGETDGKDEDDQDEEEDDGRQHSPGFVLKTKMPGVMTRQEINSFPVGQVRIKLGKTMARAGNLVGFNDKDGYLRKLLDETVAAVGPEVARDMIMSF
ncbi:arginine-tRNA-protein transferase [Geopyxis carbonaria]|nr:arginine-tRNA-protein transferase [Geopyxis carbonaria]